MINRILPFVIMLLLASCAGKKAATEATMPGKATATTAKSKAGDSQTEFLSRIYNGNVTATNIVASADFKLTTSGKDLSCDGKISMRRNEIIRLQLLLPLIRTEIARIDFTPDYVLLVDRFHKEYIKAQYKDVSFLADNGISFYSLQALFWNELFLPGEKTLTSGKLAQLACGVADMSATVPVTYKSGNIAYAWTADKTTAKIKAADITYASRQNGTSTLKWRYDNFATVAGKAFPLTQQFAVTATVGGKTRQAQLAVKMGQPKTSADWDTNTQLSAKYKQIEAQDILKKLMSIQ